MIDVFIIIHGVGKYFQHGELKSEMDLFDEILDVCCQMKFSLINSIFQNHLRNFYRKSPHAIIKNNKNENKLRQNWVANDIIVPCATKEFCCNM